VSKPIQVSNEIGIPILRFLWKWKLASTGALARRFLPESKHPFSAYNYLAKLKHAGYVAQKWDEQGSYFLWTLDRAGFELVKRFLPPLKEEGYRSEANYHDWLTTAFHLGPWLCRLPRGVSLLSEQELRRFELDEYPKWAPRSTAHRSDGYWHSEFGSSSRTVSLEMEVTRKKLELYPSIGSFYGESAQINRVLWVVQTQTDAKRILENLSKGLGAKTEMHSFVRLKSYLQTGWSANIEYGAGKTLSVQSFLAKALGIPENDMSITSADHDTAMSFLETRIRQSISSTSGARREGSVSGLTTSNAVVPLAPHETRFTSKPEVSS
jgi:hypothetical protein